MQFISAIFVPGLVIILSLLIGTGSPALGDWKADWEKTVSAAKKEARLSIYLHSAFVPMAGAFIKKYPEIKAVTVSGRGADLGSRILSEARAGRHIADIYIGGPHTVDTMLLPGGALDSIKDALILPEVLDESKWITGRHRFTDRQRMYNYAFMANRTGETLAYNAKLVKPDELNSYWSLLDPKWRGKIVSLEPTERRLGGTLQIMYYHPDLGPKYIRKLYGEMDVALGRDVRLITDWLARGKFHICLGCIDIGVAMDQGLPVNVFDTDKWKEGGMFSTGGGTISLIRNAPNPNAARVFINWFLSQEGQIAMQEITYPGRRPNSGRIDIPKDMVSPMNLLRPDVKYYDVSTPEWMDMDPIFGLTEKIMQDLRTKRR